MKFESEFGIGEVVFIMDAVKHIEGAEDHIAQILAIIFSRGAIEYLVEIAHASGPVQRLHYQGWQLTGDPTYDQEKGEYPPNPTE